MKRLLFITGTRADFGKVKPLIARIAKSFEYSIFVTGMHTMSRYGYTVDEIHREFAPTRLESGFRNIHMFMNQIEDEPMDLVLGNTIQGISRYLREFHPDMIIVHGDRVEALAGATCGALNNILVAHIEGGEISGTIDELIRHAVSKLSHLHFVANTDAARRLIQMGERTDSVYVIGSPDIDVMLQGPLPELQDVLQYYNIPFSKYGICIFHPVTTDLQHTQETVQHLVKVLLADSNDYIVIYPNNDMGCDYIFREYEKLTNNHRFRLFPSIRFEYFLRLMSEMQFIIGNSSAGIRESVVFGRPAINIGMRQAKRFSHESILDIDGSESEIAKAIQWAYNAPTAKQCLHFGDGHSAERFEELLRSEALWRTSRQKQFVES